MPLRAPLPSESYARDRHAFPAIFSATVARMLSNSFFCCLCALTAAIRPDKGQHVPVVALSSPRAGHKVQSPGTQDCFVAFSISNALASGILPHSSCTSPSQSLQPATLSIPVSNLSPCLCSSMSVVFLGLTPSLSIGTLSGRPPLNLTRTRRNAPTTPSVRSLVLE